LSFLSGLLGDIAAPLIGGAFSFLGGERRNDASAQQAAATNQTAIELANTAHQREVKDLRAAGLNPILSANRSGAALPSLNVPQFQDTITPAVSSALDAQRTRSSTRLQDAQARQREPFAMVADVLAKILDRFLPSGPKSDTPVADLAKGVGNQVLKEGAAISGAVSKAYNQIPEPLRMELDTISSSVKGHVTNRAQQLKEASKSLGADADWRDVYNFIRRGMFDNSAKSSYQSPDGRIRYNLTNEEFHSYARKDPRYKKYYPNNK